MVHMTPDDLPAMPVEELARFLLGCAKEDPALLARSNPGHRSLPRALPNVRPRLLPVRPPPVPPPPQLRLRGIGPDPEVEELVSIAVACARRAEDALQHAREVSWMARRRMSLVAAVSGGGILIAMGAIVLDRLYTVADPRLTQFANEIWGLSDAQRQTAIQVAAARADVAALRDSTASVPANGPASLSASVRPVGSDALGSVIAAANSQISATPAIEQANPSPAQSARTSGRVPVPSEALAPPATVHVSSPGGSAPTELSAAGSAVPTERNSASPVSVTTMASNAAVRGFGQAMPVPLDPAQARAATNASATSHEQTASPIAPAGEPAARATPAPAEPEARPAERASRPPSAQARSVPQHRSNHEARVYRPYYARPVQQVSYSPPYVLSQVVANVRRGLYEIFH